MRSNAHIRAAVAAIMLIATSRVCFAVACNDTITTKETLTADLDCNSEPALTIGDGGSLDLNAFKVTCNGSQTGILLAADKTSVSNGSVGNCVTAIRLAGSGQKVTGIRTFNSGAGIYSSSSSNTGIKIKDSVVDGASIGIPLYGSEHSLSGVSIKATTRGIEIQGNAIKLKDVTIMNASVGVYVGGGGGNKFSNVRSANGDAVLIASSNNQLTNIHGANYQNDGIHLEGADNKLAGGTLIASSTGAPYGIYSPNGARNKISKYAVLDGNNGILNYTPENEISKSTVFAASEYGISWLSVSPGIISGNVAVGNGTYDLEDVSPDCSGVTWSNNVGQKGKSCIQ